MGKKLNNQQIQSYLIQSVKAQERQQRINLLEKCMENAALMSGPDAISVMEEEYAGVSMNPREVKYGTGYGDCSPGQMEQGRNLQENDCLRESIRQMKARERELTQIIRRLMVCLSVLPDREQDILMTFYLESRTYADAIDVIAKKWNRQETVILGWRKKALEEMRELYNSDLSLYEIMRTSVSWDTRNRRVNMVCGGGE